MLRQTISVEEYHTHFEILFNKITGLRGRFALVLFFSGLKDDLRIVVNMFKPTILSTTFGLARLQDEEVWRRNKSYRTITPISHPIPHQANYIMASWPNPI